MSHFGPTIILEPVDLRSLRSNVANQNLSNPDFSLQSLVQDRLLTVEELLKMRCINFSKLRWIFWSTEMDPDVDTVQGGENMPRGLTDVLVRYLLEYVPP